VFCGFLTYWVFCGLALLWIGSFVGFLAFWVFCGFFAFWVFCGFLAFWVFCVWVFCAGTLIGYSADAFLLFYVFLFVFTFSFSFFLYPHTLSLIHFSQIFTTGTFPYFCFCHKYIFLLLQLFALTDH